MPLTEFLYVDDKRLNAYFEQISSPIIHEKVPVWNGSLSLAGPKIGTELSIQAREYTRFEKISKLNEYLNNDAGLGTDFFLISTIATKLILPTKLPGPNIQEMAIWITPSVTQNFDIITTCLVEDSVIDEGFASYKTMSVISVLNVLIDDFECPDYKLGGVLKPNSWEDDTDFHKDPLSMLTKIGGKIIGKRNIECLYRKRLTAGDYAYEDGLYEHEFYAGVGPFYKVTLGYPIWITAA